jgi:dicarboxylate transporter 10
MVPYLRTYSLVRFSVYDSVKNHFEKTGGGGPVPVYKLAIAGSIAGAAGGRKFRQHSGFLLQPQASAAVAGNPADIVLVRMISDVNRAPAEQLKYKHG